MIVSFTDVFLLRKSFCTESLERAWSVMCHWSPVSHLHLLHHSRSSVLNMYDWFLNRQMTKSSCTFIHTQNVAKCLLKHTELGCNASITKSYKKNIPKIESYPKSHLNILIDCKGSFDVNNVMLVTEQNQSGCVRSWMKESVASLTEVSKMAFRRTTTNSINVFFDRSLLPVKAPVQFS